MIYTFVSIGSIPSNIGALCRLTTLFLHFNKFTGSIPSSLGSGCKNTLLVLRLDNNELTGKI